VRILVIHQYFLGKNDAGGSRWNQFAKYWARAGHQITVLAGMVHYATGEKPPEYKRKYICREKPVDNVQVLRCHVSESYNRSFLGRFWAYISFTCSSIWAGMFYAGRQNVIICTSPPLTVGLTGWVLSRCKRIPMVFEVRDLWPESAIDTGVLTNKSLIKLSYFLEKKSYAAANWINVLTPAFEKTLIEKKNIRADRISMIPNGADLDIFKPGCCDNRVRDKHNLQNNFVVTYVGAHGRANHLIQLLKAARILKDTDPQVKIMLVGDGMEKNMLRQKAELWQLNNVLFVNSVPKHQIVDYLAASDVCTAVLKKVQTFKTVYPNKVFDYMAAAKPTILAIDGVARELIQKADAGIYVEPENAEEFAQAVLHLRDNARLRQQYGENGLEFVRRHFARDTLAEKYLNLLQEKVIAEPMEKALR